MNDIDSPKLEGEAPKAYKLGGGGQVAPTAPGSRVAAEESQGLDGALASVWRDRGS